MKANEIENEKYQHGTWFRKAAVVKALHSPLLLVDHKIEYIIGIDPGTKTGIAIYSKSMKALTGIGTCKIHEAFEAIKKVKAAAEEYKVKIFVRVEDARKRKWFGDRPGKKQQGAGAIKIQCKQWEEFLKSEGISYQMIAPSQVQTKMDAKRFKQITGWSFRTSSHGRDAAMMVYGL